MLQAITANSVTKQINNKGLKITQGTPDDNFHVPTVFMKTVLRVAVIAKHKFIKIAKNEFTVQWLPNINYVESFRDNNSST